MLNSINFENSVDLKKITVDTTKPLDKRIKQYINEVKNPYKVRVGDIFVKIEFEGEKSLFNALVVGFQM